jgi:hypothetical protein
MEEIMEINISNFTSMQIRYLQRLIHKMQLADAGVVDDATYQLAVAKLAKLYESKGE